MARIAQRAQLLVALTTLLALALFTSTYAEAAEKISDEEAAAAGCSRMFTREIHQVCGSDGTIYTNPSILRFHQCVARYRGQVLEHVHMSHCDPNFDDTQDL